VKIRTQWGISVQGFPPTEEDVFDSQQEATEAIWSEGGELLMKRQISDWTIE